MVGSSCFWCEDTSTYGPFTRVIKFHGDPYDDFHEELAWGVTRFTRDVNRIASLPNLPKRRKTPLWPPDASASPKVAAKLSQPPSRRPWRSRGASRPGLGLRNFRKVV